MGKGFPGLGGLGNSVKMFLEVFPVGIQRRRSLRFGRFAGSPDGGRKLRIGFLSVGDVPVSFVQFENRIRGKLQSHFFLQLHHGRHEELQGENLLRRESLFLSQDRIL